MEEKDYGDILADIIAGKEKQKKAEAEEEAAKKEELRQLRLQTCRPLIDVLKQVKAKYPRASIHNLDWHAASPYFYTNVHTTIHINLLQEGGEGRVQLVRHRSGYGVHVQPAVIASAEEADELIPELLELLSGAILKH